MYRIRKEEIKTRNMIVYYFDCPACSCVIDDLDCSLTGNSVICPSCGNEIIIGNLCSELDSPISLTLDATKYPAIHWLRDTKTEAYGIIGEPKEKR